MTNPVLNRELKTILRSSKTLYILTAYQISLFLLVVAVWPDEGVYSFAESASQSILTIIAMGQLLLVSLFAPTFTATAIVWEKENQSFDLLFFTLLRPHSIVMGKLIASLAGVLLLVFSALPVSSVCFFLGGVSMLTLVHVYAVLCAAAVFFGIVGLMISSVAQSSHSALVWSYVVVLFFSIGVVIPYYVLEEWTIAKPVLLQIKALSPFASMMSVVQPQIWLSAGERVVSWDAWLYFPALAGAGTVLAVLFLLFQISRPPSVKARSRDVLVSGAKQVIKRKLKFPFYLIDPMKRKRQIGRLVNCIFEKERRSRMFGNLTYIVRGMYACLIISLALTILSCSHLGVRHLDFLVVIAMAFQLGIVILVVPALSAGSVTQEIESNNLEMLKMTPLSAWTIVSGKIQYAALMLIFLLISCAPIWFMLGYVEALSGNLLPAAAILAATVAFSISCGTACSTFSRRTSTATAVTYSIVLFVSVVTLLPIFLGDVLHRSVRTAVLSINPFVASVQAVASGMFRDMPELWQNNLKFLLVSTVIFLIAATLRMRRLMGQEK